jgi:hypothetical protein
MSTKIKINLAPKRKTQNYKETIKEKRFFVEQDEQQQAEHQRQAGHEGGRALPGMGGASRCAVTSRAWLL